MALFADYLQDKFSVPLGLSSDDIDELVEDLSDWGINGIDKFEKHFILASRHEEGISDRASEKFAQLYKLDSSKKYYDELSTLDYEDYLFFFHGDI